MWSKAIGSSEKIDASITTRLETEFSVSGIVSSMKLGASIEASG